MITIDDKNVNDVILDDKNVVKIQDATTLDVIWVKNEDTSKLLLYVKNEFDG